VPANKYSDHEHKDRNKQIQTSRVRSFLKCRGPALKAPRDAKLKPILGVCLCGVVCCQVRLAKEAQEAARTAVELDDSNDLAHHLMGRWHFEMAQINFVLRQVGSCWGVVQHHLGLCLCSALRSHQPAAASLPAASCCLSSLPPLTSPIVMWALASRGVVLDSQQLREVLWRCGPHDVTCTVVGRASYFSPNSMLACLNGQLLCPCGSLHTVRHRTRVCVLAQVCIQCVSNYALKTCKQSECVCVSRWEKGRT